MIKLQIDGTSYQVREGKSLLETCLALGFDVPYFCYHPAMDSVGACRLCAVKKFRDGDDKKGQIVMSCMEPVKEGLIISLKDPDVIRFRASILESLMTNHPHDCPICDEGGECHLQDMTVMTGHDYRRFSFKKRTYDSQYLGPFIQHEMNRCIQCYRCVRFYKDYAGGKDLDVFGSANHVYFGRRSEGILENEFSGNLVEVCPTGVFTDKTLKSHYARKWDMTHAPSVCVHCSLGCNTIASERYGSLRRISSRYNGSVNGYFLCDRGRFGYEFVNHESRITQMACCKDRNESLVISDEEIMQTQLAEALDKGKRIAGIGSPRASLEANFALMTLVGKQNFYQGISELEFNLASITLDILANGVAHTPSLKEIEKADAILVLGEDLTNTAPMAALAIRQATRNKSSQHAIKQGIPKWHDAAMREMAQDEKSPLYIATSYVTKLDELAEDTVRAAPHDIARLGFAIASILDPGAPKIKGIDKQQEVLAEKIAGVLKLADNPIIITGTHSLSESILHASANIALSLRAAGKNPGLSIVVPECNFIGTRLLGGESLNDALEIFGKHGTDTLVILENNLYKRAAPEKVNVMLEKCGKVIVLDYLINETTQKADILLPDATYAESHGTLVNNEGRAQRFYSVLPVKQPVKESWRWILEMIKLRDGEEELSWDNFDNLTKAMIEEFPVFSKMKGYQAEIDMLMLNEKIPRQTMRYSGRTAIHANIAVSEPRLPEDPDSPLVFSMEGNSKEIPAELIPYYWSPGWNSPQAINKYLDEPNGHVKGGDPGVRLFESPATLRFSFFTDIPEPFVRRTDEWLLTPVYKIFGSEELSAKAKAISSMIPELFVALNQDDLERLGFSDGQIIKLELDKSSLMIKVNTDNSIPIGIAGISYNLPGMNYLMLPGWSRLKGLE